MSDTNPLLPNRRDKVPLVSLIVPVFNEEDAVACFVDTVEQALCEKEFTYEILFVNDGSHDRTLERLVRLSQHNTHIRILNFSRNFGKEAALTGGIDVARGDVLVPIDVDLQDPPELIPSFVAKWREGYDVVYGVRTDRTTDSTSKRTTASWFYRIFNRIACINIPENAGDFRLIDRRVADALKQLPERNRFMKGLFAWVGFRATAVPYARPARTFGTSKWNYWKLWNFALDGLVSFSSAPLRLWAYVGGSVATIAFLYMLVVIIKVVILGVDAPGYASLMSVVLFIGGVQLLSIGIVGEYISRLFDEVKKRPIYIVEGFYRNGSRQE